MPIRYYGSLVMCYSRAALKIYPIVENLSDCLKFSRLTWSPRICSTPEVSFVSLKIQLRTEVFAKQYSYKGGNV